MRELGEPVAATSSRVGALRVALVGATLVLVLCAPLAVDLFAKPHRDRGPHNRTVSNTLVGVVHGRTVKRPSLTEFATSHISVPAKSFELALNIGTSRETSQSRVKPPARQRHAAPQPRPHIVPDGDASVKVAQSQAFSTQRAYLSVIVNGVDEGQVLAIIRNGDVLVPVADVHRAGLNLPNVSTQTNDGVAYVSLQSLSPTVAYTFNERALTVNILAQPQYFGSSAFNMGNRMPAGIAYSSRPSAFFNYALNWENLSGLGEFSELGFTSHNDLYYSGVSIEPGGHVIRGLTNATFDNPALMKRWVVGDTFASGGLLGGNTYMGGISISRDFALNPYFVQFPGVSISGQVLTPSTAQVYVNGHLVSTQNLAPGPFDFSNLPVVAGGGNAQVVVRDAFGHVQTLSSTYYYSTNVLARGISQYSYNLGAERFNLTQSSGEYGPVVFIGQDLIGITNWFTGGGRLDAGSGVVSGGPTASFRLGHGQLGVAAALSEAQGSGGGAAQIDYTYQNSILSYGASLGSVSARYATASLSPTQDRTTRLATAFTGVGIGKTSFTVSYTASALRDAGTRNIAAFTGSVQLSPKFDLVASADNNSGSALTSGNQYFLSLNYQLGSDTLGAVSQQGGNGGAGAGISVEHSLPLGTGVGYLFSHGSGSEIHDNDYLQLQTSFGLYQASYFNDGGSSQTSFLASGGLIDAGDGIMFARAVEDGYAVVDVPGVSGVRGYYNNQLIGRTDSKGRLLIPNLLSYYGNRIEISADDIPLDYSVDATELTVAPSYRGGALARFPVKREMAVTGRVVVGHDSIPAFGEVHLLVGNRAVVAELDGEGKFYLEDLSAGRYSARIEYAQGSCMIQIVVPHSVDSVTSVGRLACTPVDVGNATP